MPHRHMAQGPGSRRGSRPRAMPSTLAEMRDHRSDVSPCAPHAAGLRTRAIEERRSWRVPPTKVARATCVRLPPGDAVLDAPRRATAPGERVRGAGFTTAPQRDHGRRRA
jgi:hypothetical protein